MSRQLSKRNRNGDNALEHDPVTNGHAQVTNGHNAGAVKVEVSPAMLEQLQDGLRGLVQKREELDKLIGRQEGACELMSILLQAQEAERVPFAE